MKKYRYLYIGVIFLIILFVSINICVYEKKHKYKEIGKFNLSNYTKLINSGGTLDREILMKEYKVNVNVQEITDSEIAKKEAEIIWLKIYGKDIKKQKPYKVSYDKNEGVWLVEGTIKENMFFDVLGGVAYALIKANGEVIAVWHDV